MESSVFSEPSLWIGGLTSIGGLLDYSVVIVLWHGKQFKWGELLLYMVVAAFAGNIAFALTWHYLTHSMIWCCVFGFIAGCLNRRFLDRGGEILLNVIIKQVVV